MLATVFSQPDSIRELIIYVNLCVDLRTIAVVAGADNRLIIENCLKGKQTF